MPTLTEPTPSTSDWWEVAMENARWVLVPSRVDEWVFHHREREWARVIAWAVDMNRGFDDPAAITNIGWKFPDGAEMGVRYDDPNKASGRWR